MATESRQVEVARTVDRNPEPRTDQCVTPEDRVYKARCILLDVVSRNHRGLEVKGDWENRHCLHDVIALLSQVLKETD
jgi:hypothetical protein